MAAVGAYVQIARELLTQGGMAALVALLPGIGRDLVLFVPGEAGLFFFAEPSHSAIYARAWVFRSARLAGKTPYLYSESALPRPSPDILSRIPTASQLASMNDPP